MDMNLILSVVSFIASILSILVTVGLSVYIYKKGNIVMRKIHELQISATKVIEDVCRLQLSTAEVMKEMQRLQISLSELEIEEKMTCIREEGHRILTGSIEEKRFVADLLVGNCRAGLKIFRLTSEKIQEDFGKLLNKSLLTLRNDESLQKHFSELFYDVEDYIGFLELENEKKSAKIARTALAEPKLLKETELDSNIKNKT